MALRLGARRTREGVCSTARGPAHPVDGFRPQNRARRIFRNGESNGASAGVPARSQVACTCLCPLPGARRCSLCLPPFSGRHVRAIWSHGDCLGGPGAAESADADDACVCVCSVRFAALVRTSIAIRQPLTCAAYRIIARSVFRRVLGSTVTPVNDYRCFGYPELHMFHVV